MLHLSIAFLGYTRLEETETLNSSGKAKSALLRSAEKICACPPPKLTGLQENYMHSWEKVFFIFFNKTLLLAYAVFLTEHLIDSSLIRPAFLGELIMLLLKCVQ